MHTLTFNHPTTLDLLSMQTSDASLLAGIVIAAHIHGPYHWNPTECQCCKDAVVATLSALGMNVTSCWLVAKVRDIYSVHPNWFAGEDVLPHAQWEQPNDNLD